MIDLLRIDQINDLQHPLRARFYGGDIWTVHDVDVQTGLMRIDVCGLLQVMHFGEVTALLDADGIEHDAEDFYNEEKSV